MATKFITIDLCERCVPGREKDATAERTYALEDRFYKIKLCEQHAGMFDRDLGGWTRLSEEIDTPVFARPKSQHFLAERKAETQRLNEARQAVARAAASQDFANRRAAEIEMELAAQAELRLTQSIPGAINWRITDHARQRAEQRGFTLEQVLRTAATPEHTYRQPWRGPHIVIHHRGDCRIVVDDVTLAVITVIDRNDRLELEPPAHPLTGS